MKVLVTGGSGQIGGYVVAELAQTGHEVIVLDKVFPHEPVRDVRYRVGDHENLGNIVELCPGVEAIAHLSAIPIGGIQPDSLTFRTNIMGTFNVHEAAALMGVPLVVSTSSQAVYGFAYQHRPFMPHYLPMDEEHPALTQDAYGLSKLVGEEIAHTYHRRNDMRVCSIRPPWVIGPLIYEGDFAQILQRARNRWSSLHFAYIDVRDMAIAYRMTIEAPAASVQDEVFNISADDSLATEPLANVLPLLDPCFETMAASLTEYQSMVTADRIKQAIGWQPRYSWHDFVTLEADRTEGTDA